MRSTPSLPSHPGPLWPRVEEPDRVLSIGYLMPNPLYTYVLNIYDLIVFMAYQPL